MNEYYVPSGYDLSGTRSPITLRKTGSSVCDTGFASPWVGVISADSIGGTGDGISQIGWDHEGTLGYCRFWEYNNNQGTDSGAVDYDCGDDAGGTTLYFKVAKFTQADGDHHYGMYTCGTSDWTTCTKKDDGPSVKNMGDVDIENAQEAWPAGSGNCQDDFMGSSSSPTDMTHMEVQLSEGGSWNDENFFYEDDAGCSHYESGNHTNTDFQTDDDRN